MPGKSVVQKLLIKEGYRILLIHEPAWYITALGELPPDAIITHEAKEPVDFIQVFVGNRQELERHLPELKRWLKPKGLLWITYPKGTSGTKTDINRDNIREYARTLGLETVASTAVDDTWSALRAKVA